jgi:CrcB protein
MLAGISVFIGSALGSVARFWLAGRVGRGLGDDFPWGILAVNASGACAAGAALAWLAPLPDAAGSAIWHLGIAGFLGGYTTVSSFSLQTLALLHDGRPGHALGNVLCSLMATLGGAGLGWWLVATALGAAR